MEWQCCSDLHRGAMLTKNCRGALSTVSTGRELGVPVVVVVVEVCFGKRVFPDLLTVLLPLLISYLYRCIVTALRPQM